MDVILLERIEKLGQMGDVVRVKPGYACNYLLPQKKALRSTKHNLARFQSERVQIEATSLERRGEAEAVAAKLDGLKLVILRQASENKQLYGSVAARDIAAALIDADFHVERRQVALESTIKTLGIHPVKVALHPEVIIEVTVNVARSESEAESQATESAGQESGAEAIFGDGEQAAHAEVEAQAARSMDQSPTTEDDPDRPHDEVAARPPGAAEGGGPAPDDGADPQD